MKLVKIIEEEKRRFEEKGILGVPNHYVIVMKEEHEREDFLYDFSSMMYKNRFRIFHSLDRYLYFNLDGSVMQIRNANGAIKSACCYDNYFEGVIGFEVSQLMLPTNQLSRKEFFRLISSEDIRNHANLVFFMKDKDSVLAKAFLEELCEEVRFIVMTGNEKVRYRGE